MLEFNENEFHFVGPVWFVAPSPLPADEMHLCRVTRRIGDPGCMAVFSDDDIARNFAKWQQEEHPTAANLEPFCRSTKDEFIRFIFLLSGAGITHVGIDPEKGRRFRRVPISDFAQSALGGDGGLVFDP